jgi:hypothetical protein
MNSESLVLAHFSMALKGTASIVTGYKLGDWGLIPDRGWGFFLYPLHPAGSGVHPASCKMGTRGSFLGGKVWLGHDADHSPPSGAEAKDRGCTFSHPKHLSWHVVYQLYFTKGLQLQGKQQDQKVSVHRHMMSLFRAYCTGDSFLMWIWPLISQKSSFRLFGTLSSLPPCAFMVWCLCREKALPAFVRVFILHALT